MNTTLRSLFGTPTGKVSIGTMLVVLCSVFQPGLAAAAEGVSPDINTPISATARSVHLTWTPNTPTSGATYAVQVSADNKTWYNAGNGLPDTTSSFDVNAGNFPQLTSGHDLRFRIAQVSAAVGTPVPVTVPFAIPVITATANAKPASIHTSWTNENLGTIGYTLRISDDEQTWTEQQVTATSLDFSANGANPLTPGKTYYIQIKVTTQSASLVSKPLFTPRTSEFSSSTPVSIPVIPPPPAPTLSASGMNTPPRVQAAWNAPSPDISSYLLEISDSEFTKATPLQITVAGTQTSREITAADVPGMAEGQTYYLRVSATNPDGTSTFSAQASATIPVSSIDPPTPVAPPTPVPTMSVWGLSLLSLALGGLGFWRQRRRG